MFLLAPPSFPHYTSPGIAPSQVSSTSAHFWKEHPHGFYCSVFVTKWWSQVVEYERCGHKQAPGCHFSPVCLSVKYCNFEGACGSGSFAVVSFNEQFLWSLGLGLIRPCPHAASGKKKAIATHRACLWMCNPLEDSPGSRIRDLTRHSNLSVTFCRAFPGWSCWNLGHQRADGVMSILTRCAHLAHFCHILKVVFIPYCAGPLTSCLLGIRDSMAAGCATEYTPRHPPSSEPYKKRPLVCHVKSNSLRAPPHCSLSTALIPLLGNVLPQKTICLSALPPKKTNGFHPWKSEAIKAMVYWEFLSFCFTGQKLHVTVWGSQEFIEVQKISSLVLIKNASY